MRALAAFLVVLLLAGCLSAPESSAPSPSANATNASECRGTTETLVGIEGIAGYNVTWDPAGLRENLSANGYRLRGPEFGGVDPWDRNFFFVQSGVPRERFLLELPANRTSNDVNAEAQRAWNTSQPAFLQSLNGFENATGLRHDFTGWYPVVATADWVCPGSPVAAR